MSTTLYKRFENCVSKRTSSQRIEFFDTPNRKANGGELQSDVSSNSWKSSSPEMGKQVASEKSAANGSALAIGNEALTLLRTWHKDGAFGGHERVLDLSKALREKYKPLIYQTLFI